MSGRRYEHCPVWDYWAKQGRDGGRGPIKPYVWRGRQEEAHPPMVEQIPEQPGDREREAWAASMVQLARRHARETIVAEIEAGRWWVPKGFTVADLDALLAETYGQE